MVSPGTSRAWRQAGRREGPPHLGLEVPEPVPEPLDLALQLAVPRLLAPGLPLVALLDRGRLLLAHVGRLGAVLCVELGLVLERPLELRLEEGDPLLEGFLGVLHGGGGVRACR